MDFLSRLMGGNYAPRNTPAKLAAFDPESRLARYKKAYDTILELCNRPRNPETEAPLFFQLQTCLDRLAALTREETRAPVPHVCLQFAAKQQIYAVIGRAAAVSQNEPIIHSSVALYAALVDSEEEDFLSSATFAKSLMRLVTRVVDTARSLVGLDTETVILELLFTISAKIRLQPDILPVWFQSTYNPDLDQVFIKDKKSFVGITKKDDFPLCYLLIDRVHHDGRIGDFARTGLLYIFEATGRSAALEEWIIASDLPTLMASGLGALYSQLSRELNILHPDATLPAVLAMSDYSTTHTRATTESAFTLKHRGHMSTFLSHLTFWQDVLDHCRSTSVKQTLLDHFQILFLQQLLYPSLLQSSDTDAGSSVAVLTYMTAILEALDYPDLLHMMLVYLLNLQEPPVAGSVVDVEPVQDPSQSPTTRKRRQSLLLLTAPKNPDAAIDPGLFSLIDLVLNSIGSRNGQTAFAALRLTSTLITKQQKYVFGTILKTQTNSSQTLSRTRGALDSEVDKYFELCQSLHPHHGLELTFAGVYEDMRLTMEAQILFSPPSLDLSQLNLDSAINLYRLPEHDPLLQALLNLLRTFFTNSVDVNLALTQTLISIASCAKIRLDAWIAADPVVYGASANNPNGNPRPWQAFLDERELHNWKMVDRARNPISWSADTAPAIYRKLAELKEELHAVRIKVPNLNQLLSGRKSMLQATEIDMPLSGPSSPMRSPAQTPRINLPPIDERIGRGLSPAGSVENETTERTASPRLDTQATSPSPSRSSGQDRSKSPALRSIFQPPPPETPSTTDVLMQQITFAPTTNDHERSERGQPRSASLNHVLTNIIILQEFVLELVAVLQIRAAVLGAQEISLFISDSVQDTPVAN